MPQESITGQLEDYNFFVTVPLQKAIKQQSQLNFKLSKTSRGDGRFPDLKKN